jgi:hypothetical protein
MSAFLGVNLVGWLKTEMWKGESQDSGPSTPPKFQDDILRPGIPSRVRVVVIVQLRVGIFKPKGGILGPLTEGEKKTPNTGHVDISLSGSRGGAAQGYIQEYLQEKQSSVSAPVIIIGRGNIYNMKDRFLAFPKMRFSATA